MVVTVATFTFVGEMVLVGKGLGMVSDGSKHTLGSLQQNARVLELEIM